MMRREGRRNRIRSFDRALRSPALFAFIPPPATVYDAKVG